MEILRSAIAGTLESSDIMITIEPNNELEIKLTSDVEKQFGESIIKTVEEQLDLLKVKNIKVILSDKGALDCTIIARLKTALYRASNEEIDWERGSDL